MIHPRELLRITSHAGTTFSAPRNAAHQAIIDCGIAKLPCLNRCCNLEKFAKPKIFLAVLSFVGFLQGVTVKYFRDTSRIWGQHYNISQETIDWLIYTNEFIVGILALLVSFYGNKIHRISWIGGLTIFHAIASVVLVVPELYRRNPTDVTNVTDLNLCNSVPASIDFEVNYIAVATLIVYQTLFAMVSVSFITHGITYLDDSRPLRLSAGYIGIALASKELGKQAGLYLSLIPTFFKMGTIFISPVWLTIATCSFIAGTLIAMFPRNLGSALIKIISASLVDLASGRSSPRTKQINDGFFKTLMRLLRNKILIINIFSIAFVQSGLINFDIFEKYFNQSRFQVSYVTDTSYTQFAGNILKQPLVAVSLIASGMVVSKTTPHLHSLVKWNIIAIILVMVFFGSSAFLSCQPKTEYGHLLSQEFCSSGCNCTFDEFQPICLKSRTYYSPCLAGCTKVEEISSRKIYGCQCGGSTDVAAEGPCNADKCDLFYALFQVNRVITSALLASTLVTNLIINMRCILPRDKATALGLEATFSSLLPYLPIRAIYGAVAENSCIHFNNKKSTCRLYSQGFGLFLSVSTIGFMFASLILSVVVFLLLKYGEQHNVDADDDTPPTQSRNRNIPIGQDDEIDARQQRHSLDTDSLLDMQNIGDDHDSVDSLSHLDEIQRRRREPVTESDL